MAKTESENKRRIRRDVILILALLAIGVSLFLIVRLTAEDGQAAIVTVDGEVYGSYPLDTDTEVVIKSDYGENTLVIKDGCADITDADCPDKICVNTHSVSKSGETITCLPHRTVVTISGDGGVDFIS